MIALAVAAGALAALVVAFVWWRFWFFHRNPARTSPPGDAILCAADGTLLSIDDVDLDAPPQPYFARVAAAFGARGRHTCAATYLSIWDVHTVRAPCAGRARLVPIAADGANVSMGASFVYTMLRRPLPLSKTGYRDKNELLGVQLGDVLLVLMADWWIDQIDCFIADGAHVERGQTIARIRMGSQVDVFLPAHRYRVARAPGAKLRAGAERLAECGVEVTIGTVDPASTAEPRRVTAT